FRRDDSRAAFAAPVTRDTPGQAADVDLDVTGVKRLWLVADDAGDGIFADHVVWAEPRFDGKPVERWASATQGYGQTRLNRSATGKPLGLGGKDVTSGIGTHASSTITIDVPAGATRFRARAGLKREGASLSGG